MSAQRIIPENLASPEMILPLHPLVNIPTVMRTDSVDGMRRVITD